MRKRLGCLSTSGLISALVTWFLVVIVAAYGGGKLFSPGRLNAQEGKALLGGVYSHADLGGRCAACHAAPWSPERMADRCVTCHQAIGDQLRDPDSLHGALTRDQDPVTCHACHTEHQGPEGVLTRVDPAQFPHQAVGYSLEGHQQTANGVPFACSDCHGEDLTQFDTAACRLCHRELDAAYMEAHQGDFGPFCLDCHDGVDSYGEQFDHDQLAFPLLGRHALLDCADCHPAARSVADLQATPELCYDCHRQDDPHEGQLGQDCAQCHSPAAWGEVVFDHAASLFPLMGKHSGVDCQACHQDLRFKGTPQDCFSCHREDDAHGGSYGTNCGQCHTPLAWGQVTFDHSATLFPLTGAHLQVACLQCHVNGAFGGTPRACGACHAEPAFHIGLVGTDCAACHQTSGWVPAAYDRAHRFPLNHGADSPSSCRTCHPDNLQGYTCYHCHEHDPGEIAEEHLDEGISDFQDCAGCHPTGEEDAGEGGGDNDD